MRNPKSRFFISDRIVNLLTYGLLILTILSVFGLRLDPWRYFSSSSKAHNSDKVSLLLSQIEEVKLADESYATYARNPGCRFWDCFNIYRCDSGRNERLKVYVYPLQMYTDASGDKIAAPLSREFFEILKVIIDSPFYTANPNEACLFVPSLDLLNLKRVEPTLVNQALANLPYWNNGENHLIFNMLGADQLMQNNSNSINTDRAIILAAGFDTWTYRAGFDVALPVLSPFIQNVSVKTESKKLLLVIAQLNLLPKHKKILHELAEDEGNDVLMLQDCNAQKHVWAQADVRCSIAAHRSAFQYPHVLAKGTFCLLGRSINLGQPDLLEMLVLNCIPVIAIDNYVLPFEEVLDWSSISLRVQEADLRSLHSRLSSVSAMKILELQQRGKAVYENFFKDVPTFTLKTLKILEWRILQKGYTKRQWNALSSNTRFERNPLFLPMIAPKSQGFTAVILTYDRVASLFTLIQKLALVPSLQCILVIWNNQEKPPPHLSTYPRISKPLKVIQTRANKLSNRFYPYVEIETEAVLSIDDDIVMLTTDELEFGFEVWREFPDRIVGFPSRINLWNNLTNSWYYESEWTNQISMVLTGAAFYHKYWNHMYTYSMPGDIKDWVDEHMNCEDIAMNFLVANVSNKPPIKVTPRKKFKCPKCVNTEMLSADLNHMRERSACINRFAQIYGHMPLRSVEFRADPVLFKDNFPEKLKRFNNIGTL